MKLIINGKPIKVDAAVTAKQLVSQLSFDKSSSALAVNDVFVSRDKYDSTKFSENDRVEIVMPMQGG
jgi:thiamine biosynthesis protein ThiS